MPAQTVASKDKMKEHYKNPADGLDDWKAGASPGDNIEVTENDLANLKVIKNAPTPGGPVEVTQEELERPVSICDCPLVTIGNRPGGGRVKQK